jgi:hypothetical protein
MELNEIDLPDPFKGAEPYTEKDRSFFFGREEWRAIITNNLKAQPLTILFGSSGVGKSSVLRASVAYHLRQAAQENMNQGDKKPGWAVIVFSDWHKESKTLEYEYIDPLRAIKNQVKEEVTSLFGNEPPNDIENRFEQELRKISPSEEALDSRRTFVNILKAWIYLVKKDKIAGQLFIILDQFEEYFASLLARGVSRDDFAEEFPDAVNDQTLNVNFLIAIREDALAKLDFFKTSIPNLFKYRLEIKHLEENSARKAIVGPIAEYNRQRILLDNLLSSRLTILYGDSETHKSTLLRDGIIPPLKKGFGNRVILFDHWKRQNLSEEESFQDILRKQIEAELELRLDERFPSSSSDPNFAGIRGIFRIAKILNNDLKEKHKFFIILDQFEEYFERRRKDQDDLLIQELVDAINDDFLNDENFSVHFLISISENSLCNKDLLAIEEIIGKATSLLHLYKDPDEHTDLIQVETKDIAISRLVRGSSHNQGQESDYQKLADSNLEQPQQKSIQIKPKTVEAVLEQYRAFVPYEDELSWSDEKRIEAPYLQNIMPELWELDADSGELKLETLNKFSNPEKKLTGAEGIIRERVNRLFNNLEEKEQAIAARILYYLVTPSGASIAHRVKDLVEYANKNKSGSDEDLDSKQVDALLRKLEQPQRETPRILRLVARGRDLEANRYAIYFSALAPAILNWLKEYEKQKKENEKQKALSEALLGQETKQERIAPIARHAIRLARKSKTFQESHRRDYVCSLLLALQAYYWNQKSKIRNLTEVDQALSEVLRVCYFNFVFNGFEEDASAIAFSQNRQRLALGSHDGNLQVWNLDQPSSDPISLPESAGEITVLAFHPIDDRVLVAGYSDGKIYCWDLGQQNLHPKILQGHKDRITSVCFSHDGKVLVSGSWDQTVRLWKLGEPFSTSRVLCEHRDQIWAIAITAFFILVRHSNSNERTNF